VAQPFVQRRVDRGVAGQQHLALGAEAVGVGRLSSCRAGSQDQNRTLPRSLVAVRRLRLEANATAPINI
jgi:hypothetical protein